MIATAHLRDLIGIHTGDHCGVSRFESGRGCNKIVEDSAIVVGRLARWNDIEPVRPVSSTGIQHKFLGISEIIVGIGSQNYSLASKSRERRTDIELSFAG